MSNGTQTPAKQKIITDFAIPYDRATDIRSGCITYTPSVLRWINLISSDPLNDIDISLSFLDRNSGDLVPILLPNGASCNLKLQFKKN
ncbi:MAG: hypothetical protein P4L35_18765 [Ignavibacteriaceae bacterium]|nr:hypothetical protein [Ignavibacteriaceae bacterium]